MTPLPLEDLLARLVAFPTVSTDSNLECIAFLAEYAEGLGARLERLPDRAGTKANLVCRLGPDEPGGLALVGHTDVVPTAGQRWTVDPFALTPGRAPDGEPVLHGRGTADMKGFIAQALAAVAALPVDRLRRPLTLIWTYDEEVGCLGAGALVARWEAVAERRRPAWALIGEPSDQRLLIAHKGHARMTVAIRGVPCHSALPDRGVNAIVWMGRALAIIDEAARARRAAPRHAALFPEAPFATVNAGRITGGEAVNIVAEHCRLDLGYRIMPGEEPAALFEELRAALDERLRRALRAAHPQADLECTLELAVPAFLTRAPSPLRAALETLGAAAGGEAAAPYTTEASTFAAAGVQCLICGPGSIAQAHRADEYVARRQWAQGPAFLGRVIEQCCLA